MKKVLSLVLCLILVVLTFTACKEETVVYYDESTLGYANLAEYVTVSQYKNLPFPLNTDKALIEKVQKKYHEDMESLNLHNTIDVPKVADGDTVIIDYVGKKDGKAFEGGTANGQSLVIGSDSYIDGFEDGLIGVDVGETVDLNLTFPKDYGNADLAGQKVVFTVTVKSCTRKVYPTLSSVGEVMAQELGYDNLKAYEDAVIKGIKTEYIWSEKIVDLSTIIKYPEKELNANKEYFTSLYQNLVSTYGQETVDSVALSNAQARTKEELVGYYIFRKEGLKLDEKDVVDRAIKDYGSEYTAQELENTRVKLTMEKAIEFCLDSAVES